MRAASLLALTAIALWGCTRDPEPPVALTSANGHAFTFYHLPDADEVAISLIWKSDWAHRPEAGPAVPTIGTRMLLSGGSDGMGAGEMQEAYEDIGAEGNLWPTSDGIRGILIAPEDHITRAVEIANTVIVSPSLELGWLERISDDMAIEAAARYQEVPAAASGALQRAILETRPLARFVALDDPQAIRTVTLDDIQAWRQDTMTTSRLTAVIAGSIGKDEAGDLLDQLLDGMPAGTATDTSLGLEAMNMTPRRILLHRPDANNATILAAGAMPPLQPQNEFDEVIGAVLLGGNEHSVLFETVRTEMRAGYDFGAHIETFDPENRLLIMQGEVENNRLSEVLDAVMASYEDFRTDGLSGNIDDIVDEISGNLGEMMADPVMAAETILQLHLGDFSLERFQQLAQEASTRSMDTVRANTKASFPSAAGFVVVAVSSDANALPGACVIEDISEVATCSSR